MTTHLTTETVQGDRLGGTGSRLDEQGCAKCAPALPVRLPRSQLAWSAAASVLCAPVSSGLLFAGRRAASTLPAYAGQMLCLPHVRACGGQLRNGHAAVLRSSGCPGLKSQGPRHGVARRLVGVARLAPVDDVLLDRFLGLPTDCKAVMSSQFLFPS